jgi:hypothetical protein
MKITMKAGPKRDAIVNALFQTSMGAPLARSARDHNRLMGIQAELQVALGLRKPEDAVAIVYDRQLCPHCKRWYY